MFNLKNDTIFVIAEAAGGVYNTNQIKVICEISEEDSAFLKVTEDERLGFMIPQDKIEFVQSKFAEVGLFLRHYRSQNFASPKACLGDLCPHAKQDALGTALELAPIFMEKLKNSNDSISVGINGCSIACVASVTDDIHLVGNENGYVVYLGGKSGETSKLSEPVCKDISKEKIGDLILSLLNTYFEIKNENEKIGDVVERVGMKLFAQKCEPFQSSSSDSSDALPLTEELGDDLSTSPPNSEGELGEDLPATIPIPTTDAELGEDLPATIPIPTTDAELGDDLPATIPIPTTDAELGDDLASSKSTEASGERSPPMENKNEEKGDDRVSKAVEEEDDYIGYEKSPITLDYDDKDIPPPPPDAFTNVEDDPSLAPVREKEKLCIKVIDKTISVKLPNGLDFFIPCGSLKEGESIEMQLEKELFIIENMYGKLHIKFDGLELSVPLTTEEKIH